MFCSKFQFFFIFLLFFISTTSVSPTVDQGELAEDVEEVLSNAGYNAMSLTLQMTLSTLIPKNLSNSTITVFSPSDEAFSSLEYSQPPLTLLQYHVAPMRLERKDLEVLLKTGSKIDTLLVGHPLVVTTVACGEKASINDVEIKEWDVYNDGHVIVHGVVKFFDPSFQILEYPWYDNPINGNNSNNNTSNSGANARSGNTSTRKLEDEFIMILLGLLLATVLLM